MELRDDEKRVLAGCEGRARQKAMEILVALGKIFGASHLVSVSSVQVSGVSYHNLGEAGLEWLEEMALDGQVSTVATLNPAGMDLERWSEQGIDEGFASAQLRVINAYRQMGLLDACTCTPYLVGNVPAPGEHVAWSESSAVAMANTVFGARTNREGGPSALAAALTGRTPAYGLHLDENRHPVIEVVLDADLPRSPEGTAWWGVLGAALGRMTAGRVARVVGAPRPGLGELKSLCAAIVTYGGSPLVHLAGVTGEADRWPKPREETCLTPEHWDEARGLISDGESSGIDLVCLGCPHASLAELAAMADLLDGQKVRTTTWICTARATALTASRQGLVRRIEGSGAQVVCDTCFVVAPLKGRVRTLATDSVKGCFYAHGHNGFTVKLGSVEQCLAAAVAGRWE